MRSDARALYCCSWMDEAYSRSGVQAFNCIIHAAAPVPGPYMMSMPGSGRVEEFLGGRSGSEDGPAWR